MRMLLLLFAACAAAYYGKEIECNIRTTLVRESSGGDEYVMLYDKIDEGRRVPIPHCVVGPGSSADYVKCVPCEPLEAGEKAMISLFLLVVGCGLMVCACVQADMLK